MNHLAHGVVNKLQQKKTIIDLLKDAGFDPNDARYLTTEELIGFASRVFPELYMEANKPIFEIHSTLANEDGSQAMGIASVKIENIDGIYTATSIGVIKLAKMSFLSFEILAGVIGHELIHVTDYVSGRYTNWLNNYNGKRAYVKILTETNAYRFEHKYSSPIYNPTVHKKYEMEKYYLNLQH